MDIDELLKRYAYPDRTPWLRANMIATLDGGIQYKGDTAAIGYPLDHRLMEGLRGLADIVIMGAATVREYDSWPDDAPPLAVVSRSLDLDFEGGVFEGGRTIVVTCSSAPEELLDKASGRADVMLAGETFADIGPALDALAERGYQRMLCEGGPRLLAQVAAAGWLHELCLTLSPMVTSGDASRIMNGPVLDTPHRMRLMHAIPDSDYLFTRYAIE
ncbi:dihydrofolate reductase family protein [Actinomadura rupiterrae]|uniref:dihydrofolate reductase family protein n=1 Tax=Actinomadura rupiterrae TaxID=559627 RepID=UPI0020A374A7|nr:dihydrofolate reductase family protein [Actinomadura rupiterrae]MCP2337164.1 riboflavin biosynthesis pyrimidine reductase [Actinomadura rupiterrae]